MSNRRWKIETDMRRLSDSPKVIEKGNDDLENKENKK